jgi:protein dithiol oxidoreductase (disulfide-forming)
MKRVVSTLATLLICFTALQAQAASPHWVEGVNYVRLDPVQHTTVAPGKIEVMEVFSYACPFCYQFQPVIEKLRHSLPANAEMVFLPASFHPEEDWTVFQQAYFSAQSLGIAARAHQAIFDAVWKTGELAIADPTTHRLRNPLPSIEDVARCYGRITGVKPETFLAAARSFGVNARMRIADGQIVAMQIPSTPCLVVNGKYRVVLDSLNSTDEVVDVVKYLVARESAH